MLCFIYHILFRGFSGSKEKPCILQLKESIQSHSQNWAYWHLFRGKNGLQTGYYISSLGCSKIVVELKYISFVTHFESNQRYWFTLLSTSFFFFLTLLIYCSFLLFFFLRTKFCKFGDPAILVWSEVRNKKKKTNRNLYFYQLQRSV